MSTSLKVLGLALVAALALSAAAASAVIASTPRVTTAEYTSTITEAAVSPGTEFTLEGGRKIVCSSMEYTTNYTLAESAFATWFLEFTPTCNGPATATIMNKTTPATITTNGCKFTLNSETTVSPTEQTGSWNINCPMSAKIEIHVWQTSLKHLANETALCTYSIGHQTNNLAGITFKLVSGTELEIAASTGGIAVERTTGSVTNCGAAAQSGGLTGRFKGEAKKGGVTQNLSMDPN